MTRPTKSPAAITRFVRSTRLRRRLWFAAASLATHGLFVGVALYLIDWGYPTINGMALWVGITWLALVSLWHVWHRGVSLGAADGALGLQDRLTTWWSLRNRQPDAVTRWLESDLQSSLEELPAHARGQLWRRPARRLLWLIPLLFVVWWIGPIGHRYFLPSPYGVTDPSNQGPESGTGQGDGPRDVASQGDGDKGKSDPGDEQEGQPKGSDPKQKPPKPAENEPAENEPAENEPAEKEPTEKEPEPKPPSDPQKPEPQPPKPIVPLPGVDAFTAPDFIGDGDGKKQLVNVAVIEDPDPERPAGSKTPKPPRTKAQAAEDEARRLEFEKAQERALRDRHVPENERAFVKRYFAELLSQTAAKAEKPRQPAKKKRP